MFHVRATWTFLPSLDTFLSGNEMLRTSGRLASESGLSLPAHREAGLISLDSGTARGHVWRPLPPTPSRKDNTLKDSAQRQLFFVLFVCQHFHFLRVSLCIHLLFAGWFALSVCLNLSFMGAFFVFFCYFPFLHFRSFVFFSLFLCFLLIVHLLPQRGKKEGCIQVQN